MTLTADQRAAYAKDGCLSGLFAFDESAAKARNLREVFGRKAYDPEFIREGTVSPLTAA